MGQMMTNQLSQQPGMPQQTMNLAQQSTMMGQGGLQQSTVMAGQQQMNTVNLQGHHTSRSPSQSISQQRAPSISPHTNIAANARTTPLTGQVQMVSPPGGGIMHSNNYNRTLGGAPLHGLNYSANAGNQITPNQSVMTDDNSLEQYVTNKE